MPYTPLAPITHDVTVPREGSINNNNSAAVSNEYNSQDSMKGNMLAQLKPKRNPYDRVKAVILFLLGVVMMVGSTGVSIYKDFIE